MQSNTHPTLDEFLEGVPTGRPEAAPPRQGYEEVREELHNKKLSLHNSELEQAISLRLWLSWSLFVFVVVFVIIVLLIVVLCGAESVKFQLPTSVLVTLLTTMTTSIIGLLVFVVKHFFPEVNSHRSTEK